jgi:hypothetical protein
MRMRMRNADYRLEESKTVEFFQETIILKHKK